MTPFLAYLARRKYELQKQIEEEHEYSLYLSKYKGAYEELSAVILQLPEWERDIVESLFTELSVILKEIEGDNYANPIQT